MKAYVFLYDAKGDPFAVYAAPTLAEAEDFCSDWPNRKQFYDKDLCLLYEFTG